MAYVLSSVSGNLISAASAGFAPTNSAEVSAIASAYQVVSATATQLYAGTAYVTSINEAPVSAARAGNAANASLATSAYYDGTGRLISSLPDNAAVSAIASSYAESAASGKQDILTFGYDTSDNISSINGSSLGGQGGTTYESPSGTVWISGSSIEGTDSAYFPDREETVLVYSSYPGSTSVRTGYDAYTATGANIIYASGGWLNGTLSALANNVLVAKSSYAGNVTMFSASANSSPLVLQSNDWWSIKGVSAYSAGITPASVVPLAHASSVSTKLDASASSQFQPSGKYQPSGNYLSASTVGYTNTSYTAVTSMCGIRLYGNDSAYNGVAVASGINLSDSVVATAVVGTGHNQVSVRVVGSAGQYFHVSAMNSAGYPVSSITLTVDPTGQTFIFASASAISSMCINGNNYSRHYSYTASAFDIIPLAHASALPTYQYDAEDKISSINGSAIAGGGAAGIDSATCSAIASAYAESAVSSVSGNYYSTSNPSGFLTAVDLSDYATTAYVDSSVSSKLDATASSQFLTAVPAGYATTADVESAVSGKLDSSASSSFYRIDNPSGFLTAAYAPTFGYDGAAISSIDGSALAGGGTQVVSSLQYKSIPIIATATASGGPLSVPFLSGVVLSLYPDTAIGAPLYTELSSITSLDLQLSGYQYLTAYFGPGIADVSAVIVKQSALNKMTFDATTSDYQSLGTFLNANAGLLSGNVYTASIRISTTGFSSNTWADGQTFENQHPYIAFQLASYYNYITDITYASGTAGYYGGNGGTAISGVNEYPLYAQMSYQTQPSYKTAYASASSTQATAQDVLYILIPDGV